MNSNNKIIVAVIVVVAVVGITYVFYAQPQPTQAPNTAANQNVSGQPVTTNESAPANDSGVNDGLDVNVTPSALMSVTVTYDGASFSPASVTIKQGGTVNFVDESGNPMWLASNPHPAHSGYDGTSRQTHCAAGYVGPKPFDECSSGTNFSFMFGKIGSWGYHDHFNSSANGTVVVVQ